MLWHHANGTMTLDRPRILGIVNVTPDSFSDGGQLRTVDDARRHVDRLVAEGADIIDIGGESTRPGAQPVEEEVELARVVPIVESIACRFDVAISIDTSKPAVMAAALAAGACIVNDIRALTVPGARAVASKQRAGVCLMHMQGSPSTMQIRPHYNDVTEEVSAFLKAQIDACLAEGIHAEAITIDPGVGFGKALEHSLSLLRDLPRLGALGFPLLVGVSRKTVIGRIIGKDVHERLYGALGLAALAVRDGARIIRTHDVAPTLDAIRMVSAVMDGRVG